MIDLKGGGGINNRMNYFQVWYINSYSFWVAEFKSAMSFELIPTLKPKMKPQKGAINKISYFKVWYIISHSFWGAKFKSAMSFELTPSQEP